MSIVSYVPLNEERGGKMKKAIEYFKQLLSRFVKSCHYEPVDKRADGWMDRWECFDAAAGNSWCIGLKPAGERRGARW